MGAPSQCNQGFLEKTLYLLRTLHALSLFKDIVTLAMGSLITLHKGQASIVCDGQHKLNYSMICSRVVPVVATTF